MSVAFCVFYYSATFSTVGNKEMFQISVCITIGIREVTNDAKKFNELKSFNISYSDKVRNHHFPALIQNKGNLCNSLRKTVNIIV